LEPTTTPLHDDVEIGDPLPELTVEVTTTIVVTGALASRDFYPGHHDKEYARRAGMQDVFMNILTTNGWLGRYLTDWAGPDAVLDRLSLRLGVPNYPGDAWTLTGTVVDKRVEDGRGLVDIDVVGRNPRGNHVTARAVVDLPLRKDGR
jgi:acyl dehydratase